MKVRIKRVDPSLPLPDIDEFDAKTGRRYPRQKVAGFDLYCRESVVVQPQSLALVPINNIIETPLDHFLLICARSSTTWKKGLMLANGIGVLDPFFSGDEDELKIQLFNFTDKPVTVERGEALVQGMVIKREPVDWEEVTEMGSGGHGGYVKDDT